MRKPRPVEKPRRPATFITTTELRLPMTLTLSFDRSVSIAKAQETARKLLDRIEIGVLEEAVSEELGEASLRCPALRRSIRLIQPTP